MNGEGSMTFLIEKKLKKKILNDLFVLSIKQYHLKKKYNFFRIRINISILFNIHFLFSYFNFTLKLQTIMNKEQKSSFL